MITNFFIFFNFIFIFYFNKLSNFIVLFLSFNNIKLNSLIIIFSILSLFYVNNYVVYTILVISIFLLKLYFPPFLNLFLFGFFKIHTPLFYFALLLFFTIPIKNFITLKLKYNFCLLIAVSSLFLGGFWALYLYSWGFYWSNDSIEYVLLILSFCYVVFLHKFSEQTIIAHTKVVLVIYMLYLIRSSLIYTKHNFFQSTLFSYMLICVPISIIFNSFFILNYKLKFFSLPFCFYYYLYPIITLSIIFNLLNIIFFKNVIYNFIYIFTVYLYISIGWSTIYFFILHFVLIIIVILFFYFDIFYLLLFNFEFYRFTIDSPYNLFSKNLKLYTYGNYFEIVDTNGITYNKLINIIKKECILSYTFFKKLINFFA